MGDESKVTYIADEKEPNVLVAKEGDKVTRYVLESDLLAVKGSRLSKEDAEKELERVRGEAKTAAIAEASKETDAALHRALQAEARVSSLQEQIDRGGGTAAELARATAELATAKSSSEVLGNKYLTLKRDTIMKTYRVPKETVGSKNLQDLELFEEALKAVMGNKAIGNYAAGGGGGGASPHQGKSPIDLAIEAYSTSK